MDTYWGKVDQADGTTKIISDTIAPHIIRMDSKGSYDLTPYMFDFSAPTTSVAPNQNPPRNHGDATAATGLCDNVGSEKAFDDASVWTIHDLWINLGVIEDSSRIWVQAVWCGWL